MYTFHNNNNTHAALVILRFQKCLNRRQKLVKNVKAHFVRHERKSRNSMQVHVFIDENKKTLSESDRGS